jgi:tetratricopeptide (TPR) repeat protein
MRRFKSLATSTPEDRESARRRAGEIMALPVSGLYLEGDAVAYLQRIADLPASYESIKRLALGYDHTAVILVLGVATDLSKGPIPQIDRAFIEERAFRLMENALKHEPGSSILYATAAQMHYTLNDLERGFPFALRAVELDPQNAEAWRLVGNGYMKAGDDVAARDAFERALAIEPNLMAAREALALLQQ